MFNKFRTAKLAACCAAASLFAFAQPTHAAIDRTGKRVDIIVDNTFYADEDVMTLLGQYAKEIKQKYNLEFYIYPYAAEPLFGLENAIVNESARQLKAQLQSSYADNKYTQLEGAILVGNLPKASMEFFNGYQDYYRWQTDFYFMDLDGEWRDELSRDENSTTPNNAPNGIFDGNYSKDRSGQVGDDFEIWISRVDPYMSLNRDMADFSNAKELLISWLEKALRNHQGNTFGTKGLIVTEEKDNVDKTQSTYQKFKQGLTSIYGEAPDEITKQQGNNYFGPIEHGYDWVTFTGHSNGYGISNGPHTIDFISGDTRHTDARVFHFASCSPLEAFDEYGNLHNASIGAVHIFATTGNAVAAVGATRVSGGDQHDDMMYNEAKGKFLAEGFLKWINRRPVEYPDANREDVFDWFYAESFIGDPFVVVGEQSTETVDPEQTSGSFMAFDNNDKPWTSSNANVSYDNSVKVGNTGASLKVEGSGYKIIESPLFANTDINNIGKTILLDVKVPSNQYWYGDVQLYVNIPSAGIYYQWIGQAMLNDEGDQWNTVSFQLSDNVYSALAGTYTDAKFYIALNSNQTNEAYYLDNMRFDSAKAQPKPSAYAVTLGSSDNSAICVDGRSTTRNNANASMTIQKR